MIYDLKRYVVLRWLFNSVLHSSLDDLVFYINLIYSQRTQELAATYDRFWFVFFSQILQKCCIFHGMMECVDLFTVLTISICSLDLSAKDRVRAPWLADITSPSWTSTLWTLFSYSLHACLKHSNVIFIDTHLNIFLRWDQQPCALSATNLLGWKKETGDREREKALMYVR